MSILLKPSLGPPLRLPPTRDSIVPYQKTSKDERGDSSQEVQCLVLLSEEPHFGVSHNSGAFTDVWNEDPEVHTFPHHPGRTRGSLEVLKQRKIFFPWLQKANYPPLPWSAQSEGLGWLAETRPG